MTGRLLLFMLLLGLNTRGQETSEKLLFSVATDRAKTVVLTLDTVRQELIYRYGPTNHPELEVRDDLSDSIPVFTYSYYLRGGGASNAGLDLNYVSFVNKGYKYVIYSEYSAEMDETTVGVRTVELKQGKSHELKGIYKTVQGSLIAPFRWDHLIPTVEME